MNMRDPNLGRTCRALLKGAFICPVAFPDEFRLLDEQESRASVESWLDVIDMRLARLSPDGAFFMAPQIPHDRMVEQARREFVQFRDVYGPIVSVLDTIRRAGGENQAISVGGTMDLAILEAGLNRNTQIATDLQATLKRASSDTDYRDLLEKAAKLLLDDGYVVTVDGRSNRYRFTGKIARIDQALDFLHHHAPDVFKRTDEQAPADAQQTRSLFEGGRGV